MSSKPALAGPRVDPRSGLNECRMAYTSIEAQRCSGDVVYRYRGDKLCELHLGEARAKARQRRQDDQARWGPLRKVQHRRLVTQTYRVYVTLECGHHEHHTISAERAADVKAYPQSFRCEECRA